MARWRSTTKPYPLTQTYPSSRWCHPFANNEYHPPKPYPRTGELYRFDCACQVSDCSPLALLPEGFARASHSAVAELGLGTGSLLGELASQRSAVRTPHARHADGVLARKSFAFAPGGIRTPNSSSEDCCDIHFTTRAQSVNHTSSVVKKQRMHYNA